MGSLSLLPSFLLSFSLYTNTVHAYHFTQYLLNCADVRTTRQIVNRKSLLFLEHGKGNYTYIYIHTISRPIRFLIEAVLYISFLFNFTFVQNNYFFFVMILYIIMCTSLTLPSFIIWV